MSNNDTSDEAMIDWFKTWRSNRNLVMSGEEWAAAWREAVRRCDARLDTQANQHMEALAKAMADNVRLMIEKKKLKEQTEERERKAFEAGFAAYGCCLADPMGFSMEDGYTKFKESK